MSPLKASGRPEPEAENFNPWLLFPTSHFVGGKNPDFPLRFHFVGGRN